MKFILLVNSLFKKKVHVWLFIVAGLVFILNLSLDISSRIISLERRISGSQINISIAIVLLVIFLNCLFIVIQHNSISKLVKCLAMTAKYVIFLFLIVPVWFLYKNHKDEIQQQQDCEKKQNESAILIASFSKLDNNNYDVFSNTLCDKLNSILQSDTMSINLLSRNVGTSSSFNIDSLKDIFHSNCRNRGLFIFGNRIIQNYDRTFDCRIYNLNFLDYKSEEFFKKSRKNLVYIQSPNELDFTIGYQVNTISSFILGLIYRKQGEIYLSNDYFNKALNLNKSTNNTQFISICRFFLGNNFIKLHNLSQARLEYTSADKADSTNEYIHYNIAAIFANQGNIRNAYREYAVAHSLNPKLINPLKEISTLTMHSKPNNLLKPHFKYQLVDSLSAAHRVDTNKKQVLIKENWNEQCYTVLSSVTQKYGVINNRKDTIVKCLYDGIESFVYKNADCFIVRLNNKFGAFIHLHYNYGYTLHEFPLEYSERSIRETLIYCIDNHSSN